MMLRALALWTVLSQALTVTIKPATPFQVTWDQPSPDTPASFRFWCDGAIVRNFAASDLTRAPSPNVDGSVSYTATVPGLPAGTHACLVSAFNDVAEAKSDAVPLVVGIAPATPIKLRIVVSVGGGGLRP